MDLTPIRDLFSHLFVGRWGAKKHGVVVGSIDQEKLKICEPQEFDVAEGAAYFRPPSCPTSTRSGHTG